MRRYWTKEEIAIVQSRYPTEGPTALALLLNRKKKSVLDKAFALGIHVTGEYTSNSRCNHHDVSLFTGVKTPFAAYFLGLFWADGYLPTVARGCGYNVKINLVASDFTDIKDMLLSSTSGWKYCVRDIPRTFQDYECQPQGTAQINSKTLHSFLATHDYHIKSGATPDKILSRIPAEYRHYWWRGYFDGDGHYCVRGRGHVMGFTSCLTQDWSFVTTLARELGISYRVRIKARSSQIIIAGHDSIQKLSSYIYEGENFGLKRKIADYQWYLEKEKRRLERWTARKTSRYRGVRKQGDLWFMRFHYKKPFWKSFRTEEDAARAYDLIATFFLGDAAQLNFPNAA